MLTIGMEDYFHSMALRSVVDRRHWPRFETRFEKNTLATLDLLDARKAKATFFVMSSVAAECPQILREVVRRGHRVGSAGVSKKSFRQCTPAEFREDLRESRGVIEAACGQRVHGFRVADRKLTSSDLWALEALAEEGYDYDSSLSPSQFYFRKELWRRFAHQNTFGERKLWEFPLPAINVLGCMIPIAGGNYFRQFPESFVKAAVDRWDRNCEHPFVMYFRIWDLDPEQPRITGAPLLSRIRQYRNGAKMPRLVEHFLDRYRFTSIEEHLGLAPQPAPVGASAAPSNPIRVSSMPAADRTPVTVVVPCFNEELVLPYLSNTLRELNAALESRYDLRYILVDDGSSDGTWKSLQRIFAGSEKIEVLRHLGNQGVAAAILTGIRHARTEAVCSIDCDCTYDPHGLEHMIPLLSDGVDLVTASPYHPAGAVLNVPRWRLALSKTASLLYGWILRQPVHTYTSCFRVYRRAAVLELDLREKGFLGVAELIGKMALRGSKIVEYPATLETRMLGRSKMRIARTLAGHLGLMAGFARQRIWAYGEARAPVEIQKPTRI